MTKGLYPKYILSKGNGEPLNPRAKYFILRYDCETEREHLYASVKALGSYCDEIKETFPDLANDLWADVELELQKVLEQKHNGEENES